MSSSSAVAPLDDATVQQGLEQLVEAELLYQRGLPPQARYLFKHALIQEAAYQSLLKSTRQQHHQRIAQVLEERFPETVATQPELLAHHYTEAGLMAQAIPYWQRAGSEPLQRSAYVEAIQHLTTGLALLKTLPDTPERAQQELVAPDCPWARSLIATKGYAAPDVEQPIRGLASCVSTWRDAAALPGAAGPMEVLSSRGEFQTACELGDSCFTWPSASTTPLLLEAY